MRAMLSTKDNPFDPFTQYDQWSDYDEAKGYYSANYLARIANVSDALSSEEYDTEIERAIDEIVEMNLVGNYIKVTKEDDDTT